MRFLRRQRTSSSEYRDCAAMVITARITKDGIEVSDTTTFVRRYQPHRRGRVIIGYRRRDTAFNIECRNCKGVCTYEREYNSITSTFPKECSNPKIPKDYKTGKPRTKEL